MKTAIPATRRVRRTRAEIEAAEDEIDNADADRVVAESDPSQRKTAAEVREMIREQRERLRAGA